jgi:hypothetical protein
LADTLLGTTPALVTTSMMNVTDSGGNIIPALGDASGNVQVVGDATPVRSSPRR